MKIARLKSQAALSGYCIALLMVFLMASVLLATSMTLMLSPGAVTAQQYSRECILARAITDQALSLARTDILNQMKLGQSISTSYRYPSSGTNTVSVPSYPGSGASSTVGSYYVTITNARGFTYILNAVATVGSSTVSKSKLYQLRGPAHVLDAVPVAVAAYSTRRLRLNYSGYALKARNSTGTLQDIGFDSSDNLDATALTTLLGTSVNTPPVDTVSGAVAAYSLRKLKAAYAGKAIRVRRSSDNTEQDIGFNGSGDLDTTSLLSFVGTSSGYVVTWYDQSGNALHATISSSTNSSNQPLIVNSGALYTLGTHVTIKFDGNDDYLSTASSTLFPSAAGARTMNVVDQLLTTTGWYAPYAGGTTTNGQASGLTVGSNVGIHGYGPGSDIYATVTTDSIPHIESVLYDGTNVTAFLDSTQVLSPTSKAYTTPSSSPLLIGRTVDSHYMPGYESEIIIYPSVLSTTSRGQLETNQTNYYIKGCGTVATWYDQSGNGLDATQSTVTNQPMLCMGTLNQMSGRSAVLFNGNNTFLSTVSSSLFPSAAAVRTMNATVQVQSISDWYDSFTWGSASSNSASGLVVGGSNGFHAYASDAIGSIPASTVPHVYTVTYTPSVLKTYYDNASQGIWGANTLTTPSSSALMIGRGVDSNAHFIPGTIGEMIIYARVLDDFSRTVMETSQLNYF